MATTDDNSNEPLTLTHSNPNPGPIRPLNLDRPASAETTVTADECIAHLKFLSAIADLRDKISHDDGLFSVNDSQSEEFSRRDGETRRTRALALLREKRWEIYVCKAVERFTVWHEECVTGGLVTVKGVGRGDCLKHVKRKDGILWTVDVLPPLGEFVSLFSFPWPSASSDTYMSCSVFSRCPHGVARLHA